MNPVFGYASFVNWTCQNPDLKSSLEKIFPFATYYNVLSILGKGYGSLFVTLFKYL